MRSATSIASNNSCRWPLFVLVTIWAFFRLDLHVVSAFTPMLPSFPYATVAVRNQPKALPHDKGQPFLLQRRQQQQQQSQLPPWRQHIPTASTVVCHAESESAASMSSFEDDDDDDNKASTPPGMNPERPELPELKGDFDWDAKFGNDDDWLTDNVPGKIVLNELELAAQVTALTKLEDAWRKETRLVEYEESQQVGFVQAAELANGRSAMFFLLTGLLTEYWTGYSLPEQVEEMLRVLGFIGLE